MNSKRKGRQRLHVCTLGMGACKRKIAVCEAKAPSETKAMKDSALITASVCVPILNKVYIYGNDSIVQILLLFSPSEREKQERKNSLIKGWGAFNLYYMYICLQAMKMYFVLC